MPESCLRALRPLLMVATTLPLLCLRIPSAESAERPVTWVNRVGVAVSGSTLTKTSSGGGWDAGASSAELLRDGFAYVEFTATETSSYRMLGLSHVDASANYTDFQYAIFLNGPWGLVFVESGQDRGIYVPYVSGDTLRIEVAYGVVTYRRNGAVVCTGAAAPTYPLRIDSSLMTPGATLSDVRTGNITWTGAVGVSVSRSTLVKADAEG
jgi:hypothetical protein